MKVLLLGRALAALTVLPLQLATAAGPTPVPGPAGPAAADTGRAASRPVTDSYGSTTLTDPYRWMEGAPSPEFRDVVAAKTSRADAAFARLQGTARLYKDIDSFSLPYVQVSDVTPDGETLFYLKRGPADDVARLVTRAGDAGAERVLVDPEALSDARPNSEIDQIAPSPDGNFVAFGLADAGPDSSVLRIYDASRRTTLAEHIDGARFAAASWLPDSSGFYYTRPVDGGATNRRLLRLGVFLHKLGAKPAHDVLVLDAAFLPFAAHARTIVPRIVLPPGSDYALAVISDGVSQEITVHGVPLTQVMQHPAPWRSLAEEGDGVTEISVSGSLAFLLTHDHAPTARVVAEDLADPGFAAGRTVLAPSGSVITGIAAASDALYAARREGSGMALLRLDYNQTQAEAVRLPFAGSIAPAYDGPGGLVADPRTQGAYLSLESWMHPKTWMHYDLRLHRVVDPGVVADFPRDVSAFQAIETTATAGDGTRIPLSLIARRDVAHDHARPVLIEAFGSYGYAYDARFLPAALAWANQGGVYAIAHVRGGGELGLPWQQAGRGAGKVTGMTDLLACADALVSQGYTNPAKLAAAGTNAGALVVAGAMLRQPAAFRAVLLRSGLLNPIRSEEYADGVINVAEFGSAHDPAQFPALHAMDAYQSVKPGTAYPAILLTASLGDTRVPAWHSAKLAARLAEDSTSGRPVLLRMRLETARPTHGQSELRAAEELSFLLWQLDEPAFAPAPPPPPTHQKPGRKPKRH